jgi:hypothetical protein
MANAMLGQALSFHARFAAGNGRYRLPVSIPLTFEETCFFKGEGYNPIICIKGSLKSFIFGITSDIY